MRLMVVVVVVVEDMEDEYDWEMDKQVRCR